MLLFLLFRRKGFNASVQAGCYVEGYCKAEFQYLARWLKNNLDRLAGNNLCRWKLLKPLQLVILRLKFFCLIIEIDFDKRSNFDSIEDCWSL